MEDGDQNAAERRATVQATGGRSKKVRAPQACAGVWIVGAGGWQAGSGVQPRQPAMCRRWGDAQAGEAVYGLHDARGVHE